MPDQDQILLHTKLHRPRLQHDLVFRPRLVEWLNHDLERPLTLVFAPAGFGKTTLVCSWLEGMESGKDRSISLPSAWLSLDENDSDLNLFLRYLIAEVHTIVMIDANYDGEVFNITLADVPERKNDLVERKYVLEAAKGATIAVKVTDMLGEEVLAIKSM